MGRIGTPAATGSLVKKYGFKIRKSLGQNFLIEPKFIDKIVRASELGKDQIILEIGPGMGGLTEALALAAGHVLAVEIDQSLVSILKNNLSEHTNVTITHGDALKVDFDALAGGIIERERFLPGYKVVANLPYYITTPLIMRLLEGKFAFTAMVLMVQWEVAQRIMALPGKKDYGALSIGVQYYCTPSLITKVPNTVFFPRPEVESAVIKLEKRDRPPVEVNSERDFFNLVKAAFGQRRKTLLNALSNSGLKTKDDWERILTAVQIDPKRRGETLSIEEFARIANFRSER